MEKGPRFTYLSKANGKLGYTNEGHLIIEGEHDGFRNRVNKDTTHRRKIYLRDGMLIIEDTVTDASGDVELFWHLSDEDIDWSGDYHLTLKDSGIRIDFLCKNAFSIRKETFPRSLYYAVATEAPMARVIIPHVSGTVQFETRIFLYLA